jgi:hypothetical protein
VMLSRKLLMLFFVNLTIVSFRVSISAQTNCQTTPENRKACQQFQDEKFGMFVSYEVLA